MNEQDLHAYIDGHLDAARAALVEAYLAANPDEAARFAAYGAQAGDLRAAFAAATAGPAPDSLDVGRLAAARAAGAARIARSKIPWMAAAAAILLAVLAGGGGGWLARGRLAPPHLAAIPALTQESIANYRVFAPDPRRPVELTIASQDLLDHWLSKRLNTSLVIPDLTATGYTLLGGRLVATAEGPAALLMYQDSQGERISVFTRPMPADRGPTKTMPVGGDGVHGFAWICDGLGYTVLTSANPPGLRAVADTIRRQVDPS